MNSPAPNANAVRFGKATRFVLVIVAVALLAGLIASVVLTSWEIAGRPTRTTAELVGQADLLLGALSFVLSLALVGSTLWYTTTTSQLLQESRRANHMHEEDSARHQTRDRLEREQRRVAELVGATAGLLRHATQFQAIGGWRATLSIPQITNRRFEAVTGMNRSLGDAHVAAARARMDANEVLKEMADRHLVLLEELQGAALHGRSVERVLESIGESNMRMERLASGCS